MSVMEWHGLNRSYWCRLDREGKNGSDHDDKNDTDYVIVMIGVFLMVEWCERYRLGWQIGVDPNQQSTIPSNPDW